MEGRANGWTKLMDLQYIRRAYIHTYIYTHAYIHTYIHTYIYTYITTYIHTYIYTYITTYIHTYIYTYIHTYVRTHIFPYKVLSNFYIWPRECSQRMKYEDLHQDKQLVYQTAFGDVGILGSGCLISYKITTVYVR